MSDSQESTLSLVKFPEWKVNLVERYFKATNGLTNLQPQSEDSSKSMKLIVDDQESSSNSSVDVNKNSITCKSRMNEQRNYVATFGLGTVASDTCVESLVSSTPSNQKQEKLVSTSEQESTHVHCLSQRPAVSTVNKLNKRVIFDAEDSSSEDDLVCIKSVINVKNTPPITASVPNNEPEIFNENYSGIIVDDIIEEIIEEIVAGDPQIIAWDIINSCLEKIEYKNPSTDLLFINRGVFSCTDIRYRKTPLVKTEPKVAENALSLVVMSKNLREIATFTDEIKHMHRRTYYESYGQSQLDVIRMDFIFQKDRDREAFQSRVTKLPRPKNIFLEMKSIPTSMLCNREAPSLTEIELLDICLAKSNLGQCQNVFKAFDVCLQTEDEDNIKFTFESLITLNTFLFINLGGLNDAFLGHIRQQASVYTPPLELWTLKSKKKLPMNVKFTSDINLDDLSEKFKFKVFNRKSKTKEKLVSATLDFSNKGDFYKFLTSKECKSFEIRFKIIK